MRIGIREQPSALAVVRRAAATKMTGLSHRPLMLSLAPIAILGLISTLSATVRIFAGVSSPACMSKTSQGDLAAAASGQRACRMAKNVLTRVVAKDVEIRSVTPVSDYSIHSQRQPAEWSVFCETNSGDYLLHVNVARQQIYAIGYVENPNTEHDVSTSGDEVLTPTLSLEQARRRALGCLQLLGLSPQALKSIDTPTRLESPRETKQSLINVYRFAFDDAQHPTGPVFITIDRTDGKLQRVWSRAHPITVRVPALPDDAEIASTAIRQAK